MLSVQRFPSSGQTSSKESPVLHKVFESSPRIIVPCKSKNQSVIQTALTIRRLQLKDRVQYIYSKTIGASSFSLLKVPFGGIHHFQADPEENPSIASFRQTGFPLLTSVAPPRRSHCLASNRSGFTGHRSPHPPGLR